LSRAHSLRDRPRVCYVFVTTHIRPRDPDIGPYVAVWLEHAGRGLEQEERGESCYPLVTALHVTSAGAQPGRANALPSRRLNHE